MGLRARKSCDILNRNRIQVERNGKVGRRSLDDTRSRILSATYKAVRQYGLDGVRIQNISQLAGLSQGALYRYFEGKDDLMAAAFTHVDKQVAGIFDHIAFDVQAMGIDPVGAVKQLWLPYFRFWLSHPDETVFYHRFRDSELFPHYDKKRDVSYFKNFVAIVRAFQALFPGLKEINQDLLWLHVLTATVMYAKYVVEGVLPNDETTENTVFQLLLFGLSGYLQLPT